MRTHLSTKPGLYAVFTNKGNPEIPQGKMRISCARIEIYEMDALDPDDPAHQVSFTLLPAMAEGDKQMAKELLTLADTINQNRGMLEAVLKG